MTVLQAFIIVMGLSGQVLIARRDRRGYVAWIAGNLALIVVYHQTEQLALIGLQVVNTAIQVAALISWRRREEVLALAKMDPSNDLFN